MNYTPDMVIYHSDCADGFGAAWACWMRWRDNCQYVPAGYGQAPPDVSGKHVLIVDFSYKRDILREMGGQAKSIIILDHHKTSQADLADWAIDDVSGEFWAGDDPMKYVLVNDEYVGQPIAALFDMECSGARMAWDFCHENEAPNLIQLIEDRDLWRFQFDETKPFGLWLRSEPFDFERWEIIAQEMADGRGSMRIMAEAHAIQRFFDQKVEEIAKLSRVGVVAGYEVPICNCPPMFASEVGHWLLENYTDAPFVACYSDHDKARGWSLRSQDHRIDVSEVARQFGGGGHRNAAGFGVPI